MELWQIWAIAAVALFIIEIFAPAFIAICLAMGAVIAAIAAGCGMGLGGQLALFAVGVLASFFLARPFMLKYFHKKDEVLTNVDALVGRVGRVVVTIDPMQNQGRVVVEGDDWRAVTEDDSVVEAGEKVEVLKVDSTILTVKKI